MENIINLVDIPNADTIAAIKEGDKILESGTGQRFDGTTEDFFRSLLGNSPAD